MEQSQFAKFDGKDVPSGSAQSGTRKTTVEDAPLTVTVQESTRVTVGPGFDIQAVVTGFESTFVRISNLAPGVSDQRVRELAEYVGSTMSISITRDEGKKSATAKVQYENAELASSAVEEINGYKFGKRTLAAELLLFQPTNSLGMLKNCLVRIDVPAPGKEFFAGYIDREEAERVLAERHATVFRGNTISVHFYEGLPRPGPHCLKFIGIPPDTTLEDVREFGVTEGVMYGETTYASFPAIMNGLKRMLRECGEVVSIDVPKPLPIEGRTYILVRFASPSGAAAARTNLNGRCPNLFGGKERIWVEHLHSLKYVVHRDVYTAIFPELLNLKVFAKKSFVDVILPGRGCSDEGPVTTKLTSSHFDKLKKIKVPCDRMIRGDRLTDRDGVVWDKFFATALGIAFVKRVAAETRTCIVSLRTKGTLTLYGPVRNCRMAKQQLLDKYSSLKQTLLYSIPLSGKILSQLLAHDLDNIRSEVSEDAVDLDLPNRRLIVRGNDSIFKQIIKLLADGAARHSSNIPRAIGVECPICFNEANDPISLGCNHRTCKSCLVHYLTSAHDVRRFPLTCMGDDANCQQRIPMALCKTLLTQDQIQSLIEVAFRAYIHARPQEFFDCPTTDCPQIYRSIPGKVLQCPSCLVDICPSCHEEDHGGMECALSVGEDERLYREWKESHDVKSCPKCEADIKKTAGCNHMECSQCQTHLCWVCSETFTSSADVYGHMSVAHGSWV